MPQIILQAHLPTGQIPKKQDESRKYSVNLLIQENRGAEKNWSERLIYRIDAVVDIHFIS